MSDKKETYRLTLTKEQMRIVRKCCEFYFRLMYGQSMDFTNEIAQVNCDMSRDNPHHAEVFASFLRRRDHLREIMGAVFRIAFEPNGYLEEKPHDALEAETIWDAIRTAMGDGRFPYAFQAGEEPVPEIERASDE